VNVADSPVLVYVPKGPPQKAIVGVTRCWYSGMTEIRAQSLPMPPSPVDLENLPMSISTGVRLPTTPTTVATSPTFPQWPAVLML